MVVISNQQKWASHRAGAVDDLIAFSFLQLPQQCRLRILGRHKNVVRLATSSEGAYILLAVDMLVRVTST
jgi:hypothetical protein